MSKRLQLNIDCGNAAFTGEGGDNNDDARRRECAAILREAARRLEIGHESGNLVDTNGNNVGMYRFIKARS